MTVETHRTTPALPPLSERLCAVVASAVGQDPIGTGGTLTRLMFVEMPTPWREGFYVADPQGTVLQRLRDVQRRYFDVLRAGGTPYPPPSYPGYYGIAPDPEWSSPEVRRVFLALRPQAPFDQFQLAEYRFPANSPALVAMAEALFEAPQQLGRVDEFRVSEPQSQRREFFVCTHGSVDVCCARFGVPLYRQARAAYPALRAWRTSHFGGHRYAPTAWDFPSGYKWGFLDPSSAQQVLQRSGDPRSLRHKVRGWSGAPAMTQLLDREGLMRHGWEWLSYRRRGEVLEVDDVARTWRVRLTFEAPTAPGRQGNYEGTVGVNRSLRDIGCGQRWGEREHESLEYVLRSIAETQTTAETTDWPANAGDLGAGEAVRP